jgi:putative hydrolase of the HAD superfamily
LSDGAEWQWPPGLQAVAFDVGGTLIEPWPSVGHVYAAVAREAGFDADPEQITVRFREAWRERKSFGYTRTEWHAVVRHSFQDFAEVGHELFDAIYERFTRPTHWHIFEDVRPALARLRASGLKLAAISNWDERLRPMLGSLGLLDAFDTVVVSGEVGIHKPDPGIFLHAAQQLGLAPSAILHIGDSTREDFEGARAAGLHALRLRRPPAACEWPYDLETLDRLRP